ncbi:hypothetical protein ACQPXB_35925 [Amycolatopsis sp. CA-161197]|uniref:hypothetical protein n=1 Tax=Amycolatopsis sp. CA-161197 TaxID=3239922 RepID=UPI003D8AD0B2
MRTNTLPTMTDREGNPVLHPLTGEPITAIAWKRNGQPLWPVMGGSGPIPGGGQPPVAPAAPATPTAPGTPPAAPAAPPATPPAATPPAAPAGGATPTPPAAGDTPLGPAGEKALEAERARVAELTRQLAAANGKVTEFEQAGMNDLQKAQAEAEKLRTDLATEKTERLRLQAATDHGIPSTHLHLLTATDEAALKAQATSVQELLTKAGVATAAPAPLPGQGTPPAAPAPTLAAGAALYKSPYSKPTT